MAIFHVKDPQSGREVTLEGDSPPTEAELHEIFASLPPAKEADSASSRVLTGVTDPMFGAAQLITKAGDFAGIPGFTGDSGLAQSVSDYVKAREAAYSAPEGWDFARIAGNILSPVNFVGGAGGIKAGAAAARAGAGRLASAALGGAVAGGAAGLAQPVASDKGYWGDKGQQVAAGALVGAATGAAAQKIIDVGKSVLNSLSARATPQEIQIQLEARLQQQGIDWKALGAETQQYLTDQVQRATRRGGEIPEDFLANLATLRDAGVENPTLAQITQNPTQTGTELVLRNQEAGAELASQHQNALAALNRRLGELAGRTAPPLTDPEAGARVMRGLQEAARRGDTYENALWGIARQQVGRDTPMGNGKLFARGVVRSLEDDNALESLPANIRARLASLRDGKSELTLDVAENLKNALNMARENPVAKGAGSTNHALGLVRRELEGLLDTATGSEQMRGIEFFRLARAASRDRRILEEAIPALEDVRVRGSETSPDDFLRKFVTGPAAKVSDLTALRDFLGHADPTAWQQIRGQVLYDIQQKATKGESNKFLQASYNTALRSLEKSGKLEVLFNESERDMLQKIGRAGQLLEGPQGVPRTGLLSGARSAEMLSRVISSIGRLMPGVGNLAVEPIAAAVKTVPLRAAANAALTPELVPALEGAGAGSAAGILPEAAQSGVK